MIPPPPHPDLYYLDLGDDQPLALSKDEIRQKFNLGEITLHQNIWCPNEKAWRPASHFNWLKGTAVLPPAQILIDIKNRASITPATRSSPLPNLPPERSNSPTGSSATARTSVSSVPSADLNQLRNAIQTPSSNWLSLFTVPISWLSHFKMPKWVFFLLPLVVMLFIPIYVWWTLQRPINDTMKKYKLSSWGDCSMHYVNYFQFDKLVVNFTRTGSDLTEKNLVDWITILASIRNETPTGALLQSVEIQKDGHPEFLIHGVTWRELAEYYSESASYRGSILALNIRDLNNQPLLTAPGNGLDEKRSAINKAIGTVMTSLSGSSKSYDLFAGNAE